MPWSRLNSATIQSTIALSKLSPPRWLSPLVAFTSKTPSPSSSTDTSNVPPPRSKTRIVWSESSLSRPYASAAAVGSLMMRSDVEAGDLAGVLRRLALRVVEVGGDGDDRVGDRLAEVGLGVGLQLLQDHRADLRRRVLLVARLDAHVAVRALDDLVRDDLHLLGDLVELAAHEALDREDRVLRVRDLLALRGRADEPLAVLRERDDGRRGAPASAFGMTVGSPPSSTAMQELVVPRSMPMVFAMLISFFDLENLSRIVAGWTPSRLPGLEANRGRATHPGHRGSSERCRSEGARHANRR